MKKIAVISIIIGIMIIAVYFLGFYPMNIVSDDETSFSPFYSLSDTNTEYMYGQSFKLSSQKQIDSIRATLSIVKKPGIDPPVSTSNVMVIAYLIKQDQLDSWKTSGRGDFIKQASISRSLTLDKKTIFNFAFNERVNAGTYIVIFRVFNTATQQMYLKIGLIPVIWHSLKNTYKDGYMYRFTYDTTSVLFITNHDLSFMVRLSDPPSNLAPVASFTPSSGTYFINENIKLDASGSYDPDSDVLSYRWNVLGSWTSWSSTKTHNVKFMNPGQYQVILEVKDKEFTKSTSKTYTIIEEATTITGYNLNCYVTDMEDNPLSNVLVNIPGMGSKNTNAQGYCMFTDLLSGSYTVTYTLSGYNDYTGTVQVSDKDTTINIQMTKTTQDAGYTVTFIVQDKDLKPVNNALVTMINEEKQLQYSVETNDEGQAVFYDIETHEYQYLVEHDIYSSTSGKINVINDMGLTVKLNRELYAFDYIYLLSAFVLLIGCALLAFKFIPNGYLRLLILCLGIILFIILLSISAGVINI